jgi:hypothetical protein
LPPGAAEQKHQPISQPGAPHHFDALGRVEFKWYIGFDDYVPIRSKAIEDDPDARMPLGVVRAEPEHSHCDHSHQDQAARCPRRSRIGAPAVSPQRLHQVTMRPLARGAYVRPGADDANQAGPAVDGPSDAPAADGSPDASAVEAPSDAPAVDRFRRIAGAAVVVIVIAAAGFAIYRDRHSFANTLHRIGPGAAIASFAAGLASIGATYPIWRQVLAGLDVRLPWGAGARVFFISQLGKYIPGSVWPVLLQMEAGRARGASRRSMLAGNLISIVLSCTVGLVLACLLLPLSDAHALARYWWVLLALPFLLALLHPRAIPALLDRLFGLLHRAPLGERLRPAASVQAGGWSVVSWLFLGLHIWILCAADGHGGWSNLLLCTGGMALAVTAGILFIPAPAGAGLREVVLGLVLASILGSGAATALVIASRVLLVACDLVLAGIALAAGAKRTSGRKTSHPE